MKNKYIIVLLINILLFYLLKNVSVFNCFIINFVIWFINYLVFIILNKNKIKICDIKSLKYILLYIINIFLLFLVTVLNVNYYVYILLIIFAFYLNSLSYDNIIFYLIVFFLIDYTLFISMFSPNSPIANQMSYTDSSVFRYIGLMMRKGVVPYRDIFDHKGILLYFLNYLATFIDKNVGIWFINIVWNFAFFTFSYKLARLFAGKKVSIFVTFFSSFIIFLICSGGNYVEQYAVLFITVSLFLFFRDIKSKNKLKMVSVFIIGLCFGGVFLLRPNMLILWVCMSFYLLIIYIKEKEYIYLFKTIIVFLLGILVFIFPFMIYLIINNAFSDFIYDYFIFNFNYSANFVESSFLKVLISFSIYSIQLFIILLLGFKYFKNKEMLFSILYMLLSFVIVIIPRNNFVHYLFIMVPTYIVPLAIIINNRNTMYLFTYLLIVIYILMFNKLINNYTFVTQNMDKYKKDINEIISEYSYDDNDTLIYGNNVNIYLITNRRAPNKYIYQLSFYMDDKLFFDFISELNNNPPRLIIFSKYMDFEEYNFLFSKLNNHYKFIKSSADINVYGLVD